MDKIVEASFKDWSELKNNPVYKMIEKYRITSLELPTTIPNPFPESFGFEDYTNEAIDAIQKRGRYLTMDELSNISAPTIEMQEAIQSSLKPGKMGGIIGAPAGFGKSYTFKYLGIMAAERSLSHTYLWFRGGALTDPKQLKTAASINDYHFMFTDAKNLSQTGGLLGGAAEPMRELNNAARKYAGKFVLCLDELYTALSQEHDAAGGWFALKGLTEPETLVKVIGTMASKDVPLFKKLKVSQNVTGRGEGTMKPVYDEQLRSRFHQKNVPDYTDAEQHKTLQMGGLDAITHQAEYSLNYDKSDKSSLIDILIKKTNEIEAGVSPENRHWAAPRKWKAILADANTIVNDREEEFSQYSADIDFLKKTEDLSKWYDAIKTIEGEKQAIQSAPTEQVAPSAPSGELGMLSLRDRGDKFPHEDVEAPEAVAEQKKERSNDLNEKEVDIKTGLQKILRKRRYIELAYKQGVAKLESKYGQGVFAPDMHDIGFLKPVDIQRVDIGNIKLTDEEE